uniref:Zn-finger protein n=1 Tax=Pithovirus LCPAC406 TaxID=2506599 RepID=A0A481ZG46_9VIRU|nr:MAG: uncharacterized protein LCPAC406_01640 [Pithovirus LCPAC406]
MSYKCNAVPRMDVQCVNDVNELWEKCEGCSDLRAFCVGLTSKKKNKCKNKGQNGTSYCEKHKNQDPNYNWIACIADTISGKPCNIEAKTQGGMCYKHEKLSKMKPIIEKKCTTCNKIKMLEDFHKHPAGKGGIRSICKECANSTSRALNYERKECGTKKCTKCGKEKDVSCFTSSKNAIDGLEYSCRECHRNRPKFERQKVGEKYCKVCKILKDVSMYGTSSSNRTGLDGKCRECERKWTANWLSKFPNFVSHLYRCSKTSARKRDHEHQISEDDIMKLIQKEKQICIGTGYKMTHIKYLSDSEKNHRIVLENYYNMSIDRINSYIGYLRENIQVVTIGYNLIKGNLVEEFLYDICQHISKYDNIPKEVKISSIDERFIRSKLNETKKLLRRRNLELDITLEDLYRKFELQGGLCALSGIKMTTYTATRLRLLGKGNHRLQQNYMNISFDRIDSHKNYTDENFQLVCSCVNIMKGEMPQDMFVDFCKAIANTHPDK